MRLVTRVAAAVPRSWIRAVSHASWRWPWLRRRLDRLAEQFRHQDGVIQGGAGKGLRFNTGPSNAGYLLGTTEAHLQSALRRYLGPGMTVWDAGANVGFFTVIAARIVGPGGRVISFEPLPSNAERVEYNARLNGFDHVVVRREALGPGDGRAGFLVTPDPTMGMLAGSGFRKPGQPTLREVEVAVRSIGSLIAEGVPRPDVIKLDIEGTEGEALAGGADAIRGAGPILLVELHGTSREVASALERIGYHGAAVGWGGPVSESPWNSFVVAVPGGRADLVRDVDAFCGSPRGSR